MFYFYFLFVCLFVLYSALIWIHDYALNKNRYYYYKVISLRAVLLVKVSIEEQYILIYTPITIKTRRSPDRTHCL